MKMCSLTAFGAFLRRLCDACPHLASAPRAFWSRDRGPVALIFARAIPAMVASIAAATEYGSIVERRSQLQAAADGAALAAAKELTLASADERVASVAEST